MNSIIEFASEIGSSALDTIPELDSLMIFAPIPLRDAIIGFPHAK